MPKKSIKVRPKKRGRPYTGGRDPLVAFAYPPDTILAVDQWAKDNALSRSAAIRRMVEQALAIQAEGKPAKKPIPPAAARDRELEHQKTRNNRYFAMWVEQNASEPADGWYVFDRERLDPRGGVQSIASCHTRADAFRIRDALNAGDHPGGTTSMVKGIRRSAISQRPNPPKP